MNVLEIEQNTLLPELELIFFSNYEGNVYAEYCEIKENKRTSYKPISYHGINLLYNKLKLLVKENNNEKFYKFKGLIPSNVIYYDVLTTPCIAWIKPSHINSYNTIKKKYFYKYPNLLFLLKFNTLFVYALKTTKVNMNTKLYNAPFYNVYDNGKLCMGTMRIDNLISIYHEETISNLEDSFFNSFFTTERMGTQRSKTDIAILYKRLLANSKTHTVKFPNKELIDAKKTIKDVIYG